MTSAGCGASALAILAAYLALFLWATVDTGRAGGRSVWLFGQGKGWRQGWGRDRRAALAFRLAFGTSLAGPVILGLWPGLRRHDPVWTDGAGMTLALPGVALAALGAMVALAAQMSMGASWRVGVAADRAGALVTGGLFRLSRNPTFLGQGALLTVVAMAIPSLPTLLAPALFAAAAHGQVRSEEAILRHTHGTAYNIWARKVPRWIGRR